MHRQWLSLWRWWVGVATASLVLGLLVTQQEWVGWVQAALVPLVACWLPYLRLLPWLNELRWRRRAAELCRRLAELEQASSLADTPQALRQHLAELASMQSRLQALTQSLPASCQGEMLYWRWHLDLVRREAQRRLRRLTRRRRCRMFLDVVPNRN